MIFQKNISGCWYFQTACAYVLVCSILFGLPFICQYFLTLFCYCARRSSPRSSVRLPKKLPRDRNGARDQIPPCHSQKGSHRSIHIISNCPCAHGTIHSAHAWADAISRLSAGSRRREREWHPVCCLLFCPPSFVTSQWSEYWHFLLDGYSNFAYIFFSVSYFLLLPVSSDVLFHFSFRVRVSLFFPGDVKAKQKSI